MRISLPHLQHGPHHPREIQKLPLLALWQTQRGGGSSLACITPSCSSSRASSSCPLRAALQDGSEHVHAAPALGDEPLDGGSRGRGRQRGGLQTSASTSAPAKPATEAAAPAEAVQRPEGAQCGCGGRRCCCAGGAEVQQRLLHFAHLRRSQVQVRGR